MNLDAIDICCNLLEIQYIEKMKKLMNLENYTDLELRKILFPGEWHYIEDKNLKLLMLKEAIDNNKRLSETDLVLEYYRKM